MNVSFSNSPSLCIITGDLKKSKPRPLPTSMDEYLVLRTSPYLTRFLLPLSAAIITVLLFTTRRSMDTKPSGLVSMYSLSRHTYGCCDGLCAWFYKRSSAPWRHFSTFQITRMRYCPGHALLYSASSFKKIFFYAGAGESQ